MHGYLATLVHETREKLVDATLAAKIGYLLYQHTACIKDTVLEDRLVALEESSKLYVRQ